MSPLLGPILAQLVTLGVSDRTEARYIVVDDPDLGVVRSTALATSPRVELNFGWKHTTLTLGYGPALTVTPIETKDRSLLVYHLGTASVSSRWARTTATASETIGYGKIDFGVQALADPRNAPLTGTTGNFTPTATTPPATAGAPGQPGTSAQPGVNRTTLLPAAGVAKLRSSVTAVNVSQSISAVLTVTGGVNYSVSGGVGDDQNSADAYPTVWGPGAMISAAYSPTFRDRVTTLLSTQYSASSIGNRAWFLFANESWSHRLSTATTTNFGSGLSLSRNSQPDGLIAYSIFPNFVIGINNASRVGKNSIAVGATVSSAPYVDPLRASVDPSLTAYAFVGLNRDRFSSSLTGGGTIGLVSQDNNSAPNYITGALRFAYFLGAGVSVDSGVRAAWQTFEGLTTIPPSFAVFAGITIGAQVHLHGGR